MSREKFVREWDLRHGLRGNHHVYKIYTNNLKGKGKKFRKFNAIQISTQ